LGAILQNLQRTHEAIDCYERFLEQVRFRRCIFNLGNALVEIGSHERAIPCYRKALAQDPRRSDICINLGIGSRQGGDLDGGRPCI